MATDLTAAQRALIEFAPKFGALTTATLFGDVWERPELSKRAGWPCAATALNVAKSVYGAAA